jgi:nascent polypeptide-associated complex subunit alpha
MVLNMGKLPKSLLEKKKQFKQLRSQGGASAPNPGSLGAKGVNRQMRRKMKSQGVEGMEPIEAKRVIIETEDGDLIIDQPQVIKLNQQGMEIYQVVGKAIESEAGSAKTDAIGENNLDGTSEAEDEDNDLIDDDSSESLSVEITDQDIDLVAMQTGVSRKDAEQALRDTGGNLAEAIIKLKSK